MAFTYAHLADLHLGSWKETIMRDLSLKAFTTAIDDCVTRKVDFILFAGDIFNTSLPSLETLKIVTRKLKELHDTGIPLYVIPGSHDFSPSGKTMIDVLENAGLLRNVCKGKVDPETRKLQLSFTVDEKTGAKMTGILGRKGQLDRTYYENLVLDPLEQEEGYKIFLFHTTLTELKPKHLEILESNPSSFLPKNFHYYAGGHIHHPAQVTLEGYGPMTYPGSLFPTNFSEMERYGKGGYYLISVQEQAGSFTQAIEWVPLEIVKQAGVVLNCNHKSPEVVMFELVNKFNNQDLHNTIITLRLEGTLQQGKLKDINFKEIFEMIMKQGALFIMKNTSKVVSEAFEEIKMNAYDAETMEEEIIKEHLQQMTLFDKDTELHLTKNLLAALNTSKKEGETISDFQQRVEEEMKKLLNVR